MTRRVVAGRRVGELEHAVLEVLWLADGWLTGREVWQLLGDETRAYTTVMTILGRLVDKGLVQRADQAALRAGGRATLRGHDEPPPAGEESRGHLYRAAGRPDELTAQAISSLLAAADDPRSALAHFVEGLDDPELVAELAAVLERVRRP